MPVDGIRGVVEAAIQRASQATGVDFTFLMGAAKRESGFNPLARSGSSSAGGLFQFVDQTWLSTLKKHGAKYGYARYSDLITQGADGRFFVNGAEAKKAVMSLKMDPHAASLMAGELTSDHAAYLRGRVGRNPTAGELYVAHFLGPQGSAKLIETARANPAANAAAMFPDAAQSNHSIFYRDGRAATVGEVYANLTRTGGASAVNTGPGTDDANTGFIQYASARRADRLQQEQQLVDLVLRGPENRDDADVGLRVTGSMFSSEMLRVLSESRDAKKGR